MNIKREHEKKELQWRDCEMMYYKYVISTDFVLLVPLVTWQGIWRQLSTRTFNSLERGCWARENCEKKEKKKGNLKISLGYFT